MRYEHLVTCAWNQYQEIYSSKFSCIRIPFSSLSLESSDFFSFPLSSQNNDRCVNSFPCFLFVCFIFVFFFYHHDNLFFFIFSIYFFFFFFSPLLLLLLLLSFYLLFPSSSSYIIFQSSFSSTSLSSPSSPSLFFPSFPFSTSSATYNSPLFFSLIIFSSPLFSSLSFSLSLSIYLCLLPPFLFSFLGIFLYISFTFLHPSSIPTFVPLCSFSTFIFTTSSSLFHQFSSSFPIYLHPLQAFYSSSSSSSSW